MRPNLNSDDKAKAPLCSQNPFTSSKTSVITTENPTVSAPLYGQSDPNLELGLADGALRSEGFSQSSEGNVVRPADTGCIRGTY